MDAILHAIPDHREMRVGDVQMRIDAEGDAKVAGPVRRVAVKKIPVLEISVGAGKGNRFRGLMDGKIIGFG
jgi:hypothetical protein